MNALVERVASLTLVVVYVASVLSQLSELPPTLLALPLQVLLDSAFLPVRGFLDVPPEQSLLEELLPTHVTPEERENWVSMQRRAAANRQFQQALHSLERLRHTVRLDVRVPVLLPAVAFPTHLALEGLQAHVLVHVLLEIFGFIEPLITAA